MAWFPRRRPIPSIAGSRCPVFTLHHVPGRTAEHENAQHFVVESQRPETDRRGLARICELYRHTGNAHLGSTSAQSGHLYPGGALHNPGSNLQPVVFYPAKHEPAPAVESPETATSAIDRAAR